MTKASHPPTEAAAKHPRIGILGGGQLGKMLTQAAMNFDLHLSIMDSSARDQCRGSGHAGPVQAARDAKRHTMA